MSGVKFLNKVWQWGSGSFYAATRDGDEWEWHPPIKTPGGIPDLSPENAFFCPHPFDGPRQEIHGRETIWLHADLDESDPLTWTAGQPMPTLCWATSPGRWQALWRLNAPVTPSVFKDLNARLTYWTDADSGGWSITKLLRIPGSISTKRDDPFTVKLSKERSSGKVYSADQLDEDMPDTRTAQVEIPDMTDADRKRLLKITSMTIAVALLEKGGWSNPGLLSRLAKTEVGADRSGNLWYLHTALAKTGCPVVLAVACARHSVFNKYKGQDREIRMLWAEQHKARATVVPDVSLDRILGVGDAAVPGTLERPEPEPYVPDPDQPRPIDPHRGKLHLPTDPRLVSYNDFLTTSHKPLSWLVSDIWATSGHGLLAGEAKTFKTLFALDLSVSIASGTPFLGQFPVPRAGPVLFIQEENDPGDLQDRLMRIGYQRGLSPNVITTEDPAESSMQSGPELPIWFMNNKGFSFTSQDWMEWLVAQVKATQPALIIFDPLYLMTPGIDENSSSDMIPVLANLMRLKQKFGCGILIAHHFSKTKQEGPYRTAVRMSGTGVFHRWVQSAVYVERASDSEPVVKLSGEQRAHKPPTAYRVKFDLGEPDDLTYHAHVTPWSDDKEVEKVVLDI